MNEYVCRLRSNVGQSDVDDSFIPLFNPDKHQHNYLILNNNIKLNVIICTANFEQSSLLINP